MSDSQPSSTGRSQRGPQLIPGSHVAGGRFRLSECHGGSDGLYFWRARDQRLSRDVAITFVDPREGEEAPGSAPAVLDRTLELSRVYSGGLAPVLDVIRGRGGGIIVTEWTPGRSLADAVADVDPASAPSAVRLLAEAAERAEDAGVALGLDSPDRIRITPDGNAVLAFPGIHPDAETSGDIRGLGATLYALQCRRWPLELPPGSAEREPEHGRPSPAELDADGSPRDPGALDPAVGSDASAVALRALDGTAISSAATVRTLLDDLTGVRRTGPAAAPAFSRAPAPVPADADPWQPDPEAPYTPSAAGSDGSAETGRKGADPRKWTIMAIAGAVSVVAIAALALWLLTSLAGDEDTIPLSEQLDRIEREAQQSREAEAAREAAGGADDPAADAPAPEEPDPGTGDPVSVSDSAAWEPADSAGSPDNPGSAANVFDGDPATTWSTSVYLDQFGDTGQAYKEGTGILATLDSPTTLRAAEISTSTPGVTIEVRGADSANVTDLDDTDLLGTSEITGESGTVELTGDSDYEYVLIWITELHEQGPEAYTATLSEVELRG